MKQIFTGLLLAVMITSVEVKAQSQDEDLVQFSGVVVTSDSLQPLPYTSIIIKHTYRGTISDFYGFFSFVAKEKDTIEFTTIGYRKAVFIIPDTLTDNRYSLIQAMHRDTILLKEAVIYPWPTKEQFKQAFLSLDVPDDDLARARKNLEMQRLQEIAENLPPDGSLTYKYTMQQQYSRLYTVGQLPMNNLLNPIAWAQFIKAWKNGDFKRKHDR
ncbi:MAG: carboxypeptidase-like regulatory domain-containing protein [Bacteroidia bacterium]|nr:carboxypeptidase-like regulatory domain-containing protein [Bacteroidia bacterium]MCZ2276931.1 carboxypeptidase-like regulatory domain-containing protein [Bacteroidia bacterium]